MKSWGSVVPELTFLNKPWEDLLLDPHSSRVFMPERLFLPLDTESFNKKHIFYDRAHVRGFTHPSIPSAVSVWLAILTAHLFLNTLLQPLISSPVKSWKSRDWAAKWDTRCANFHVVVFNRLLVQGCYTELLPDFWGHTEGMRCVVDGIKLTSYWLWARVTECTALVFLFKYSSAWPLIRH